MVIRLDVCLFKGQNHCLDYSGFTINFKTGKSESSNFVLPFQDCLGYSGPLEFPYKF